MSKIKTTFVIIALIIAFMAGAVAFPASADEPKTLVIANFAAPADMTPTLLNYFTQRLTKAGIYNVKPWEEKAFIKHTAIELGLKVKADYATLVEVKPTGDGHMVAVVTILDVMSGRIVNKAVATSKPYDEVTYRHCGTLPIEKALKALKGALDDIIKNATTKGTLFRVKVKSDYKRDKKVFINFMLGYLDGLHTGSTVIILQGNEVIAKAKVLEVNVLDSVAEVDDMDHGRIPKIGDFVYICFNPAIKMVQDPVHPYWK